MLDAAIVLARELLTSTNAGRRPAQRLVLVVVVAHAGSSAIQSQYPVHVPAVTARLVRSRLEGKPCAFARTALTIPIATQDPVTATVTTIAVIARRATQKASASLPAIA